MDMNDISFQIERDRNGKVAGFKLIGLGNTDAEAFCLSFPAAVNAGKGEIRFENSSIVFVHRGVTREEAEPKLSYLGTSQGGIFSAEITSEDQEAIQSLLAGSFKVSYKISWGKGFVLSSV